MTVVVLPLGGWEVAEAGVQSAVVVAVDPGEDRPTCLGPGAELVAVHDLAFER